MPTLGFSETLLLLSLLLALAIFIGGVVWLALWMARRTPNQTLRDLEARVARLENERPRS